jgi:hypothetical protein
MDASADFNGSAGAVRPTVISRRYPVSPILRLAFVSLPRRQIRAGLTPLSPPFFPNFVKALDSQKQMLWFLMAMIHII